MGLNLFHPILCINNIPYKIHVLIKKASLLIVFSWFSVITLIAQSLISQESININIKNKLKEEIIQMGKKDQQYRWQLMFGEKDEAKIDSLLKLPDSTKFNIIGRMGTKNYGLSKSQYDSILAMQSENDSNNIKRLIEIFEQYGWPGYKLVGGEATGITSTILLHMPPHFQLELYPKLKKGIFIHRL
jgi:hypothetical protein